MNTNQLILLHEIDLPAKIGTWLDDLITKKSECCPPSKGGMKIMSCKGWIIVESYVL